jgi:hypothetical protein
MTDPNHSCGPHRSEASVHDLVDALNTLRDRLLDAAMVLRDYQFETDTAQRSFADEAASALTDRVSARPR